MLDRVGDPYQMGILAGVMSCAANAGATVISFAGGQVPANPSSSARHHVFDLIGRCNIDVLVVLTASLMHRVGLPGVRSYFAAHLQNIPYCSIGVPFEGISSVVTNGKKGMRDLVSHLIRYYAAQRFAFVRGPIANVEAEERFDACVQTLEEHGLHLDPRLVAVGDFLTPSGSEAVRNSPKFPA